MRTSGCYCTYGARRTITQHCTRPPPFICTNVGTLFTPLSTVREIDYRTSTSLEPSFTHVNRHLFPTVTVRLHYLVLGPTVFTIFPKVELGRLHLVDSGQWLVVSG